MTSLTKYNKLTRKNVNKVILFLSNQIYFSTIPAFIKDSIAFAKRAKAKTDALQS